MALSRRRLMQLGLATGVAAVGGRYLVIGTSNAAHQTRFVTPLRIPQIMDGVVRDGRKHFDLGVRRGTTEFFEGTSTPTLGINGSYLGPTLRCNAGDRVTINVDNKLDFDTTLHWHGLTVPAKHDGGPHQVVRPGNVWRPAFDIKEKAALFWYHSHLMEHTGEQVNQGLAGLLLVNDDESKSLGLPSDYGVDDIPLVVQDRRFFRDGSLAYVSSMHDTMMGFKGDTILVNGTVGAVLAVRRQMTRLRILNGSNARIYNFGLSNGQSLTQIASDGSLLEGPVRRKRVRLAPGERAEVLVEMTANSEATLMSYPDVPRGRGMMGRMAGNDQTFPILVLKAGRVETSDKRLPKRLVEVSNWSPKTSQRTRNFDLNMGMMGMMGGRGMGMMGRGGGMGMMGGRGMGMMHGGMGINGKAMDMRRIDERVPLGEVETWAIRNTTPLAHPFHIHGTQFRVLDRNGRPPQPYEAGLKDTVLVDPGETVRVITKFSDYADPKAPYMYHCHILEHEDAGMMGQFVVTA